jgi:hypothetical protein
MVTTSKLIQVDASVQHLNINVARNVYVQNVMYVIRQAATCFARFLKLLKAVNRDWVWGGGYRRFGTAKFQVTAGSLLLFP